MIQIFILVVAITLVVALVLPDVRERRQKKAVSIPPSQLGPLLEEGRRRTNALPPSRQRQGPRGDVDQDAQPEDDGPAQP
jgi:hypothetical protein